MSDIVDVFVPAIGDFTDVPVIDVLVKIGDEVKIEDSLITVESDKATMDVPSPVAGVITELLIKLGDKVGEGKLIARVKIGTNEKVGADEATALQGGRAGNALLAVADGATPAKMPPLPHPSGLSPCSSLPISPSSSVPSRSSSRFLSSSPMATATA